ncbi:hypothetical protein [Frigoriglobus tundricola]|uniref:Uncharacterized protein n=1 Tax=Frigoriglobus tundricola TaxID=2774151 RepID=A0A6M5YFU7_9BACT|nr:hypothetical protein [Frigoriglobus tundricola]QJW92897.1 hypothetical protein FTUN_0394 [Frigoriglobus tundricola]
MFDTLIADALGSGLAEKVAGYAIKCLAVAGGFLIGYFLGGVTAWALDRWVFAKRAPDQLKKAVSMVAGVAVAILVALVVFGEGGNGLFGGGGNAGDGKGTAAPETKGKTEPNQPVVTPKKDEEPTPKAAEPVAPTKPADTVIHVTVLGGADVPNNDEKYYLIDDSNRKNLAQLADLVAAKKDQTKGTVGIVIQFRDTNRPSLDPEHESISKLRRWAEKEKVAVTFPAAR